MGYQYITYEKDESVAIITLNRPEVRNALNAPLRRECIQALQEAEQDEQVRVVILTGAGDKAFAAGADIGELQRRTAITEVGPNGLLPRNVASLLENMPKPTIAAVNGYALGGGCELALACTIRIASESARFGLPEINLGILPGNGGTQRLQRLVGKGRAMHLILTGDMIDAQEAYRIGLVTQVVAPDQLLAAARELAGKLATKPPLALQLVKQAVNAGADLPLASAIELEHKLFAILCSTADKTEGVTAFLEKRKPTFQGQ